MSRNRETEEAGNNESKVKEGEGGYINIKHT